VTDFVHDDVLSHLSAPETRLTAVIARPRWIALGCIVALTGLGWLGLGLMSAGGWSQALCGPESVEGWSGLALAIPMWAAMVLAMMLPTAGPMILTYAEIADTAATKREPVVSPVVLTAGYVAVWLGFAVTAAMLQFVLSRQGMLSGGTVGLAAGGALFAFAGAYQFTTLKHACLTLCQRPFPFFFSNWTDERSGVFRLGLRQGMACLGCCWAMMLLMFAFGAMNIVWMAALGVVMTIEKLYATPRFSKAIGAVFVSVGFVMIVLSRL
jgi:predicted metal-binding membrane protein